MASFFLRRKRLFLNVPDNCVFLILMKRQQPLTEVSVLQPDNKEFLTHDMTDTPENS